jgi:hypothetical protein
LVLATAVSGPVLSHAAMAYFPGQFFDTRLREPLQRAVMASWPGPTELMRLWRDGELSEQERAALLVGGAVFHDPSMLPAYREAAISQSQVLRRAAAYGYRDLLADRLPNVAVIIDDTSAQRLADEMLWVSRTLRAQSLVELWLQSALIHEGASLPGWRGVTLDRSPYDCFTAVERLIGVEDLDLLVRAFELSTDQASRLALLRLIESVTLSRFIIMPTDPKTGWGMQVFDNGLEALENNIRIWRSAGCEVDGLQVLKRNLRGLGLEVADPLAAQSCRLWIGILDRGDPRWWMIAARQLYACGGPWYELSALKPDTDRNRAEHASLAAWFAPLRPKGKPPIR